MKKIIFSIFILILVLALVSAKPVDKQSFDQSFMMLDVDVPVVEPEIGSANPAAVHCTELGYKHKVITEFDCNQDPIDGCELCDPAPHCNEICHELTCDDGIDNDCDTLVDEDDPDCVSARENEPKVLAVI